MYIFFSSSLKNQKQRKPTQNFENNTLDKKSTKKSKVCLSLFLLHPQPIQVAHPEIAHLLEEARSAAVAMGGCGEAVGGGGDHREAVDAAL